MFHAYRFSTDTSYAFLIFDVCYMPHSYHPPLFDYSSNNWQTVQIIKLLIMKFPTASSYFSLLGSNILLTPCSQTSSTYVLLLIREAKFCTYTKQEVKTINLCYLNHVLEDWERQKLLNWIRAVIHCIQSAGNIVNSQEISNRIPWKVHNEKCTGIFIDIQQWIIFSNVIRVNCLTIYPDWLNQCV